MKKPKPTVKTVTHLDYHECAQYIADKLGIKDLDNVAGKTWGASKKASDNYPYQDFWHLMCKYNEIHNGTFITIPEEIDIHGCTIDDWAKPIIKAFNEEFGIGTEYWVEW
jgi:hypothetical protein